MRLARLKTLLLPTILAVVTGCASVPMESADNNLNAKAFPTPEPGKAGLYIYRDSFAGKALKRDIYLDGTCLGPTADKVFFYTQVDGDRTHTISTETEFSHNHLRLDLYAGKNYFVRQTSKVGVFTGGAGLEAVSEAEGKRVISKPDVSRAAMPGKCASPFVKLAPSPGAEQRP